MTRFRCLITGCGRSGTKYIAAVLQKLGLRIGHERFAPDGIASWQMVFNDAPIPGRPRGGVAFDVVLHQVRHPLLVIPSLSTFRAGSWHYVARHVPSDPDDSLLVRATRYWVCWNEQAQRLAQWTYRVEDLPCVFDDFCRRIG